MATTKTSLISTINGYITAIIDDIDVRNAYRELIDEIYPTKTSDSNTLETFTTKNNDFSYNVTFVKQGRSIRINGAFTNLRNYALPEGSTIFQLKNNPFKGDTSFYLGLNVNHEPLSSIKTNKAIPANFTENFSITYNADL